jgi:hypothetical protein
VMIWTPARGRLARAQPRYRSPSRAAAWAARPLLASRSHRGRPSPFARGCAGAYSIPASTEGALAECDRELASFGVTAKLPISSLAAHGGRLHCSDDAHADRRDLRSDAALLLLLVIRLLVRHAGDHVASSRGRSHAGTAARTPRYPKCPEQTCLDQLLATGTLGS